MKKIALVLSVFFIIIIGAFLALVLLVNPNDFKPLIKEQVEAKTGRQLTMDGDIEWSFFPSLGLSISDVALSNPVGFPSPDLVKFNRAEVEVDVLPLFSHQVTIGLITLDGASFSLYTLENGVTNLDGLTGNKTSESNDVATSKPSVSQEQVTKDDKPSAELNGWKITLDGIALTNAKVLVQNDQSSSKIYLNDINLSLSTFSPGQWAQLKFNLNGDLGQQKISLKGETDLNIAVTLDNASLKQTVFNASYSDATNQFNDISFTIDQFSFDNWANIALKAIGRASGFNINSNSALALYVPKDMDIIRVKGFSSSNNVKGKGIPNEDVTATLGFNGAFDMKKSYLTVEQLSLSAVETKFNGQVSVLLSEIPKVRFELHSPDINVDMLLATMPKTNQTVNTATNTDIAATKSEEAPVNTEPETEPDLSALKTLDVAGTISIDKFKLSNAKMENVISIFSINRGLVKLSKFHSDFYQGDIDVVAMLDARNSIPTYSMNPSIKGIQIAPLLTDVMGESLVEGNGNIAMDLAGKSLKPTALKQNLKGKVAINFADGAVKGVNLPLLIRSTYAKIKGEKLEDGANTKQTDFSALTADFYLSQGNATTNNIKVASPVVDVLGSGTVNYIDETANMLIKTTIKGVGSKNDDGLKGTTIPVKITGSWADPKFKPELDEVMKQKAKKEAQRGIDKLDEKYGDKIKNEKLREATNNLLKGLFN